ncbi:lipase 3-like [Euwallacea similis]|uniref:lipase 3-like n=1 Tax=Euwallacea similis TaxID=1736056 RepID=UPI003451048D
MPLTTLLLILFLSFHCTKGYHPEVALSFEERARYHGYPVEVYQVETEDDYLLMLYRIPYGAGQKHSESRNKSAILILHGNGGTPHNFLVLGKEKAAAFYFADKGLDVWLLASRGIFGTFKQKHKKYDWNKDPEFWNFSYHEIGIYDVPAAIDFILNATDQKKVTLIGHSSGGMVCFCLFSEKPEYVDKVKLQINWGSSPIIEKLDFPFLVFLTSLSSLVKGLINYLGLVELPFHSEILSVLQEWSEDPYWKQLCVFVIQSVGSRKSVLQRLQDVELIVMSIPRFSLRQEKHLLDAIYYGGARKYDFGQKKNMEVYGQPLPGEYNLSATTVPTAFFVGSNDGFIGKLDVESSIRRLPNTIFYEEVQFDKFNHLDFIFAHNASELVYEPTYQLIRNIDMGIIPPKVKVPPES